MSLHITSAVKRGYDAVLIDVECDISNGLPSINIVGLGDKAVDEARERIRSAITNSGLNLPTRRLTLNLAPADLPKKGSYLDLPLCVAILCASKQMPLNFFEHSLIAGELSLNGTIKPVRGVINLIQASKTNNIKRVYLPTKNCEQAALIDGIEIIPLDNLKQLYKYANKQIEIAPFKTTRRTDSTDDASLDFSEIRGQDVAKRALLIAAAGGHNVLLSGPPGTGKSMLAKALAGVLPPLTTEEQIEVTKIHSLSSRLTDTILHTRPVRTPHHTSSYVSIIGGGADPKPGEVSLAHRGILLLDEVPEFSRMTLETLRQPLEDGTVTISRANETISFPADFILVATQNPCPCGFYGDDERECTCLPAVVARYNSKLSGPLLDRIDIFTRVERIDNSVILNNNGESESVKMKKKVDTAQKIQKSRYKNDNKLNAFATTAELRKLGKLDGSASTILNNASRKIQLSSRAYIRCIKVARTIADLEGSVTIDKRHISEALAYRQR